MRSTVPQVRLVIRLPEAVHSYLTEWARRDSRSLNDQMVHILQLACAADLNERESGRGIPHLPEYATTPREY